MQRSYVTHRTSVSIFFLYLASICCRYSGRINMDACSNAERFKPALHRYIMGISPRKEDREVFHCQYEITDGTQ